mgnify:CR=1 FL=1
MLIEAYKISAKLETKKFLGFGLVCFGHKSGLAHPPFSSVRISLSRSRWRDFLMAMTTPM